MIRIINRFLSYVEIRTKIASVLPFFLGLFYAMYGYRQISVKNTGLFFISMLFFDMATTALNNYIDTQTNDKPLQFQKGTAKFIFYLLFFLAVITGLLLVFHTGLVVLFCGALCFMIGILYTFGPAPISHMPLGEIFSGIFMGFFIPFLVVLINAPKESLVTYSLNELVLQIYLNLEGLFKLAVIALPAICVTANIMLANNICDLEADIQAKRFTLPYYMGKGNALRLFSGLYYMAFAAIIAMAALKILPLYVIAAVAPAVLVQKNIAVFNKRQSKEETFPLSVQNFVMIILPLIVIAAVSAVVQKTFGI